MASMAQVTESLRVKPEYVFARSSRRLAGVRVANRPVLQDKNINAPGASLLEFMTPEPSNFDAFFNSIVWQHIDNYFNSKGLGHQYAKKYRRVAMGRAKRNAGAAALDFINGQVAPLERQRDTTRGLQGRRIEAQEVLGTRIVARAVMGEQAPVKTYWAVEVFNRNNQLSGLSVLTTNTDTAGVGDATRQPQQRRVSKMAMLDPATINLGTFEPYAPPQDVINRTALYQTVETAFALLGIAANTGQSTSYPDFPVMPPDAL